MKRISIAMAVITLGLALGGCSRCGFIWDDWRSAPKSCQSDLPK
jgi:hypothetical protein